MTAAKVQPISDPRAESIVPIPLRDLRRAPWNARKTFEPAAIEQLRASIVAHGIQVPLIVRPKFDEQPNTYEIIAGHRRFEAALAGAMPTGEVPCVVRDLDDDQAREIALVDNLQREDVPALEEADAYAELKQRLGTAEAIAARVGKDVSYVARRLQLVSLAEMPRKALAERLITIDHALLLARLGVDEQNVNLKWCLNTNAGKQEAVEKTIEYRIKDRDSKGRYSPWESESVVELKHHIEQNVGRKLSRAPWPLDDAELLPAVGACSVCPSNTKANTNLFSDLDITEATCEDGGCFEFKREAFVQIRQSKATHDQANGPNLAASVDPAVRLSFRSTTVKPRVDKKTGAFSLSQTFKDGQWVEAKPKSCAYVRLGVTVDWSDDGNRGYMGSEKKLRKPGVILHVCIAEKCKAHRKAWEKAKASPEGGREDEATRKAAQEKRVAATHAESKIRVAVASKAIESIDSIPADVLRFLALEAASSWGEVLKLNDAVLPGWNKTLQTAKVSSKEFAKAATLVSLRHLAANEYGKPEGGRQHFLASVKRVGFSGADAWKRLAPKAAAKVKAETAKKAPAKKAAKKGGHK